MSEDEPTWGEVWDRIDPHGFGPMHYDREGVPISLRQWAALCEDRDYRRVALTRISEFSELSTVWLGIDHGMGFIFGDAAPLIFESMYFIEHDPVTFRVGFPGGEHEYISDREGFLLERYSTEAQALAGHDQLIEACKDGTWRER